MKTDFQAGGLTILDEPLLAAPRVSVPDEFTTLDWYDGRMYCLPPSNQEQLPACAGFAADGYAEVDKWAETGIKEQYDGKATYYRAKELEGNNKDGTTLTWAAKAAQDLGHIDADLTIRTIKTKREVQFALHKHKAVIAGFMITAGWNDVSDDGWINENDIEAIGGHAVLLCWYNDDPNYPMGIGLQNSWDDWGYKGFGRMSWKAFHQQFLYAIVLE